MHPLIGSSGSFHLLLAPNRHIFFRQRPANSRFSTPLPGLLQKPRNRPYLPHLQPFIANSLCNKRPEKARFFAPSPFFKDPAPLCVLRALRGSSSFHLLDFNASLVYNTPEHQSGEH